MKTTRLYLIASVTAIAVACVSAARANIIFTFTEFGSDVVMTPSGTLDTSKLLSANWYQGAPTGSWAQGGWNGTGVEDDQLFDLMGSGAFSAARNGPQKRFRFNNGTDISAIANPGGPFSASSYNPDWLVTSGTKSFVTYSGYIGVNMEAGIQVFATDMDGVMWTPDQTWINTGGSFASLGLNVGSYAVSDALTGETITIEVAGGGAVPDGGTTLVLLGGALTGLGALRRKFRARLFPAPHDHPNQRAGAIRPVSPALRTALQPLMRTNPEKQFPSNRDCGPRGATTISESAHGGFGKQETVTNKTRTTTL